MENQTIIRKNRVFGHKFLPKFFATIARSEMLTTESELRSARGPQRYDAFCGVEDNSSYGEINYVCSGVNVARKNTT